MTGTPANGATERRQVVRFDEDRYVPIEVWAFVLCAIAWPEEPEDGLAFSKRWSALVARAYREAAQSDDDWAEQPQPVRPMHLWEHGQDVRRSIASIDERLAKARQVAQLVRPPVLLAATGEWSLPGVERPGLMAMIRSVLPSPSEAAAKNFRRRVFEPSKPVLHLALALDNVLGDLERSGHPPQNVLAAGWNPDHVRCLVGPAEVLEDKIPLIEQFGVDPGDLVRVRLAGWEIGGT